MDSATDVQANREKMLNMFKWLDLVVELVMAVVLVVLLGDLGIVSYGIAIFLIAHGLFSFFFLFVVIISDLNDVTNGK